MKTYNAINQTPIAGRTANQVIILMTDALCNEIQNDIVQLATQIKDNGIYVMVLAIDGAQSCTILQEENVASTDGYFSAPSYSQLEQQAIAYTRDIINAACIGLPPPAFDLTMNLNGFTVVNCVSGQGSYKADYTINNIGKVAWNNNVTISFFNGDPTLPTTQLVATQNVGIQNISVNGSVTGSFTSPLLETTNYLFAIVNFNGNLSANEPPLPYNLKDRLVIAGEKNEKNNFSNGIVRVNDNTCSPKALLNIDVQAGGAGCDNTVNYNVEICNTGNATAILDEIDLIAPPNFVLNNSTSITDTVLERIWATYYGGSGDDNGRGLAVNKQGDIYITGYTTSINNIATVGSHQTANGGGQDAFLVKFNSSGVRQWATYYGGSGDDAAYAIELDTLENIYMSGLTTSSNNIATTGSHQTANGGGQDAFLVKFNSSGIRQWATYCGGNGDDAAYALSIDLHTNIYISGSTTISNNIATVGSHQTTNGGGQDAFLVKFNSSGVRQWATYYGGNGNDISYALAVNNQGYIFMAGSTLSSNNISTVVSHQPNIVAGARDAFLVKFDSIGIRQWATYYGGVGSGGDIAYTLKIDAQDNVYMAGYTNSVNNIATVGAHQSSYGGSNNYDAFLVKFNGLGMRQWGTYYGGSNNDYGRGLALDGQGNIYLVGSAGSNNNIATNDAYQTVLDGSSNAFLVKFNASGVRQWGTYYGGSGQGFVVANDNQGNIYTVGSTTSATNIATVGSHQDIQGSFTDAFLVKFNQNSLVTISPNECIKRQYTYIYTGVPAGTYNFSGGVTAQKYLLTDGTPLILPDSNFNAGSFTNIDGFNGANHTYDNVTITGNTAACAPGDKINVSVNIPTSSGCGNGNYAQATVYINNTSGVTMFNPKLYLNLTGTGASFAGELYNLTNNLSIPAPNIFADTYPNVANALYGKTGVQVLPIYQLPTGASTFNIDINLGSVLANLSVRVDSLPTIFNTTGSSNLATDAQGVSIPSLPTITGFSCPSAIAAGNSITFSGITTSNASAVKWASTTVANIPNTGSLTNPSITYSPTPTDLANGFAAISLTVLNSAGCDVSRSCQIAINNVVYDYGDAPITYDLNKNAVPFAGSSTLLTGVHLGSTAPTTETLAKNSADAKGDGVEEDGLQISTCNPKPINLQLFPLQLKATNSSGIQAYVSAFADWNNDGDYLDDGETVKRIGNVPASSGIQNYTLNFIPETANPVLAQYFVRLRISTDSNSIKQPYEASPQGEIEDHVMELGLSATYEQFNFEICQGDSVRVNNKTYKTSGTYVDTLINPVGCDTLLTTNLIVHPTPAFTQNISICPGGSYTIGTHAYTQTGTYKDTLQTSLSCDSVVTTTINVAALQIATRTVFICSGEQIVVGAHVYTTSGTYVDTLINPVGCDTLLTTILIVHPTPAFTQNISICPNGSYTIGTHTYTQAGTYKDTLQTSLSCDSVVTTIINVAALQTTTRNVSICSNEKLVIGNNTYATTGIYKDTIRGSAGCDTLLTISLAVYPKPIVHLGPDLSACPDSAITLDAGNAGTGYQWNSGQLTQQIRVTAAGTYTVTVTKDNCSTKDTVILRHKPAYKVNLGTDVTLCNKDTLVLNVATTGGSYIWQDGTALPVYWVKEAGTYHVKVTTECTVSSDTINVVHEACDCLYYVPSAFSPNGDGINDAFGVVNQCEAVTDFKFEIFNRWGELVYQSGSEAVKWDGFYRGLAQQVDDYVYILTYIQNNKERYQKGVFSLLR